MRRDPGFTLLGEDAKVRSEVGKEYEVVLTYQDAVLLQNEVMRLTSGEVKRNESHAVEMCALLDAARCLGKNFRPDVTSVIQELIGSFKENEHVRRSVLRAYPATAIPCRQVVEVLTRLFASPPGMLISELVQTPGLFAKNCRQSTEYVIACIDAMSGLMDEATALHQKLARKDATAETEFMVSELRNGIHEVSQIIVTFNEFIGARDGVKPTACAS